jgi:cation diffusion facilitator family transporter
MGGTWATHAGALLISVVAYHLAKSVKFNSLFTFVGSKIIPLGGYTSAVVLAIIAIVIAGQSILCLMQPTQIQFRDAIIVAIIGLMVNVLCALILMEKNQQHQIHSHDDDHDHYRHIHDHNLGSAYMHVVADALTSVYALIALGIGMSTGQVWLDPAMGIV